MTDPKVALRIPSFDGENDEFTCWWLEFKGLARVLKFAEILVDKNPTALPDTELAAAASTDAEVTRFYNMNSSAFYYLSQAFTTNNKTFKAFFMMGLSNDWPQGATWTVVERLHQQYRKNDLMAEVEQNRKLSSLTMNADANPSAIFAHIKVLRHGTGAQ